MTILELRCDQAVTANSVSNCEKFASQMNYDACLGPCPRDLSLCVPGRLRRTLALLESLYCAGQNFIFAKRTSSLLTVMGYHCLP